MIKFCKRKMVKILPLFLVLLIAIPLTACGESTATGPGSVAESGKQDPESQAQEKSVEGDQESEIEASQKEEQRSEVGVSQEEEQGSETGVDIPPYAGEACVVLQDNIPFFTREDFPDQSFAYYSELDELGRCGPAWANIGQDLMPTEERGSIGQVRPTGWHTVKYPDLIDGNYLYNRCHLIGYQLAGENANEKNLITGTRYLNTEGMISFENRIADYVRETGNHVLYRVTPVFEEDDLLAQGVILEGWSVEDEGEGVCFNVFAYNVQPGIVIDYTDGSSYAEDHTEAFGLSDLAPQGKEYVLNTNTKKFHDPDCSSVEDMAEKNKQPYTGNREDVITMGYEPCKRCNP